MTLLNTINVGGTDFGLLNNTVMGVCNTPAGSEVKACTFADSFELKAGVVVTIKFTYANTYGDGSTTYPKLSVNGTPYPIKYATNAYAGAGAWINGQTVPFMFDGTGFILVANLMQTSVISSANTTVNGAPLYNGANVKVMFTSALAGADTSTALVLNYNGSNITVKVPVNGALADYVAKAVDESGTTVYYFCQAYTTLELLFDGTYFVITNNPVVISNSDYVINADGSITYKNVPRIIPVDNLDTLWATNDEIKVFYLPSGTAEGTPNDGNVWFGLLYGKWNLPIEYLIGLNGVYMRTGFLLNNEKLWNPWKNIVTYP